jgi:TolB-like protein/Tfp pilus assembly protein PilF
MAGGEGKANSSDAVSLLPGDSASAASRQVFVSYASQDAALAQKVCAALEAVGFLCWIAPRDVVPGTLYADCIVHAIDESSILVLILSEHAVASAHVGRELERAASKRHPVVALRTDAAPLTAAFEYFLNQSQWIEGGGSDAAISQLVGAVGQHLAPGTGAPAATTIQPSATRQRAAKPRTWVIALIVAAVVLVGGYFLVDKTLRLKERPAASSASISDKSIAVLPFTDMSEKKDQEYFADGMAEEISALLAKIQQIKLIGRASSFQFKGRNEDLRAIGEKLGSAYIVEGSVRKAGERIRVNAQLIDARSATQVWADSYDSAFSDVLALQQQIAAGIARALQLVVQADEVGSSAPLRSPEAYTFYLHGLSELDQWHQSSLFDAQSNFERALELDPTFLRAAEALAQTHAEQAFDESRSPKAAWQDAREVANRALQLEPNSAPAHAILGLVFAADDFNWDAANAEFRKALSVRPRDPVTLRFAALVAHALGKQEEALRYINAAISIDPLNPHLPEHLGQILYTTGDLDRAEPALRKGLQIAPISDGNHFYLSIILRLKGQQELAQREARAEVAENARDAGMSMDFFARGQMADSDAALARLKLSSADRWPFGIAQTYAFRHDRDHTMEWLDKSYDLRDPDCLLNVRGDPLLSFLRGDLRYKAFLKKMNLPE